MRLSAARLLNRSDRPVTLLVVGTRAPRGTVHYPDFGIVMHHDEQGRRFTREDGSRIERMLGFSDLL